MKRAVNFINYNIATCLGLGLSPYAPGTLGTLAGLVVLMFVYPGNGFYQLMLILGVAALAVYSSGWLAAAEDQKDPSQIIIDEVVGVLVAFFLLPVPVLDSFKWLVIGCLIFRILDIWKPWPIRRLESLPGGWGIVLDDVLAGIFTNLILQIVTRVL